VSISADPPATPPTERRRIGRAGWTLIIAAVLVIVVVLVWELTRSSGDGRGASGANAISVCHRLVSAKLPDPGTAQYSHETATPSPVDSATYTVTGTVDSQGTTGAVARRFYSCTATWQRADLWAPGQVLVSVAPIS
jgi:hypothetical protein